MTKKIIFLIITYFLCVVSSVLGNSDNNSNTLYPIRENGLLGFINNSGEIVIEPKFHMVGLFTDELAPVRENGTYGYINRDGEYVISPKFDFAFNFRNGIARVYNNRKAYYINEIGDILFVDEFYKNHGFNENDVAIVETESRRFGLIDINGELILDTIFVRLSPFNNNRAVIVGENHSPYGNNADSTRIYEIGVVNSVGDFVIPFGKYESISNFKNGYSIVNLINSERKGIIDTNGSLILEEGLNWRFQYRQTISDGKLVVDFINQKENKEKQVGVINTKGETLIKNTYWEGITPFVKDRAFAIDTNRDWYLINEKGQKINDTKFDKILLNTYSANSDLLFQDGIQFIKRNDEWGAINSNGKFILEPIPLFDDCESFFHIGKFLVFNQSTKYLRSSIFDYKHGFVNAKTKSVVKPMFNNIIFPSKSGDLIYTTLNNRMIYLDDIGNYVWQEESDTQQFKLLNIDYMRVCNYEASSPYKQDLAGYGGWSRSDNSFNPISETIDYKDNSLNVLINSDTTKYEMIYEGMSLYIANITKDTFYFNAQDSELYLNLQAKDMNGEWQDIEYIENSWCGNSYHTVFLPPNNQWQFTIPIFEGEFKTKIRAKLHYKTQQKQKEDKVLYSNEFEASINPGQFWRKSEFAPDGIIGLDDY